ncbi:16867_t:CDS:2, partial [Acaulospora colombiana]
VCGLKVASSDSPEILVRMGDLPSTPRTRGGATARPDASVYVQTLPAKSLMKGIVLSYDGASGSMMARTSWNKVEYLRTSFYCDGKRHMPSDSREGQPTLARRLRFTDFGRVGEGGERGVLGTDNESPSSTGVTSVLVSAEYVEASERGMTISSHRKHRTERPNSDEPADDENKRSSRGTGWSGSQRRKNVWHSERTEWNSSVSVEGCWRILHVTIRPQNAFVGT